MPSIEQVAKVIRKKYNTPDLLREHGVTTGMTTMETYNPSKGSEKKYMEHYSLMIVNYRLHLGDKLDRIAMAYDLPTAAHEKRLTDYWARVEGVIAIGISLLALAVAYWKD